MVGRCNRQEDRPGNHRVCNLRRAGRLPSKKTHACVCVTTIGKRQARSEPTLYSSSGSLIEGLRVFHYNPRVARRRVVRKPLRPATIDMTSLEPFWEEWAKLTPAERLRQSWRRRGQLRDPIAAHDARTFPKL